MVRPSMTPDSGRGNYDLEPLKIKLALFSRSCIIQEVFTWMKSVPGRNVTLSPATLDEPILHSVCFALTTSVCMVHFTITSGRRVTFFASSLPRNKTPVG